MLITKKIGNNQVAVCYEAGEIYIRESGKKFFGTERRLAYVKDGVLHIDAATAKEYGIKMEMEGEKG